VPRSSPIQASFNAGKWGPRLQGRVDIDKYSSACNVLENFIPTVQGPALKRSGTRFLKAAKSQSAKSRLIPFEFSTEQAYVLELYEGGMRVIKDSGAVLDQSYSIIGATAANPVVVSVAPGHDLVAGQQVYISGSNQTELNGRFFEIAAPGSFSFQLVGEDGSGRSAGTVAGTAQEVFEIRNGVSGNSFPWLEAELDAISFVQNGDLLFLAHPNHPPHKITRTAHTAWTCEEIVFSWPPFSPENIDDVTFIECTANTGKNQSLRIRGNHVKRQSKSNAEWVGSIEVSGSVAGTPAKLETGPTHHGLSTGDTVWVWDLNNGPATLNDQYYTVTVPTFTVVSTTSTTPVVVETSVAYGGAISGGDTVYVSGLNNGASVLNDALYTITALTATTFELDGTTAYAGSDATTGKVEHAFDVYLDGATYTGSAAGTGYIDKILTDFRFNADQVGGYYKLREIFQHTMPEWKASTAIEAMWPLYPGSPGWSGQPIYYESNVYTSLVNAPNTGLYPPIADNKEDKYFLQGGPSTNTDQWEFYNRGSGYVKVVSVSSDGLQCVVDVIEDLPYSVSTVNPNWSGSGSAKDKFQGQATLRWSEGAFSEKNGYPQAVAFFEDRLWFGGTKADPQTFWGSKTGEYEDFEQINDDPSSSVLFTLASRDINAIEWLSGDQQLVIGTRGGEFVASGASETEAITASNITVRRQSNYGVRIGMQPLSVDSALLFVQRAGERLHQLVYSNDFNRYVAPDLTAFSDDILRPSASSMAYQSAPFRQVFVRLSDGNLVTLTYSNDQDVLGWAQLQIGGTDVQVESVAVIPHPDGDQDQTWLIVKRTINGATARYIEHLEKPFTQDTALDDAFFVDSGLTYSGAGTSVITGLWHLEGERVHVFAEGHPEGHRTVSGGQISIPFRTKVQVGLEYTARLQTMRLEAGAADGTAQGRRKRIHQLVMRVDQSAHELEYGADFDTMDTWQMPNGSKYTGDSVSFTMPGGYEREGRIALRHHSPAPLTVVALFPQLTTESR